MTPTPRSEHAVEACSDCGTHLYGGWVQRTREVIELPVVPVEVTEHVLVARICPYASGAGCPKRLSRNPAEKPCRDGMAWRITSGL